MNKLIKNGIITKILILSIALIVLNLFVTTPTSLAADDGLGGKLLKPVIDLVVSLGDGVIEMLHSNIMKQDEAAIRLNLDKGSVWKKILGIALIIIAVVVAVILTIKTAGALAPLILKITGMTLTVGVGTLAIIGGAAGYLVGSMYFTSDLFGKEVVIPLYTISPEKIFSNEIPFFDINFFNPSDPVKSNVMEGKYKIEGLEDYSFSEIRVTTINQTDDIYYKTYKPLDNGNYEVKYVRENIYAQSIDDIENAAISKGFKIGHSRIETGTYADMPNYYDVDPDYLQDEFDHYGVGPHDGPTWQEIEKEHANGFIEKLDNSGIENMKYIVIGSSSASEVLTIRVIYVWKDGDNYQMLMGDLIGSIAGHSTLLESTAGELRDTISKWYYTLRNLAIIVMLSILVYVGIRILLSSIASEKAKYKNMFFDWIIGFCLIFVIHYIMVFAVTINEKIIDLVSSATDSNKYVCLIEYNNDVKRAIEDAELSVSEISVNKDTDEVKDNYIDGQLLIVSPGDGKKYLYVETDLLGAIRINTNMGRDKTIDYVGWTIMFIALVMLLLFFMFTYLKRVLYMAFLTVIAPLVAMTYCIDKLHDGQAQAFNMWLKEYIFNLLIQPVHLVLYTVLVSSALELATSNIIYSIVAIGFMVPAEKLLRKFFGFEKAQTPGALDGAGGAALIMSGMQALRRIRGNDNSKDSSNEKDDIRTMDSNKSTDDLLNSAFGGASSEKESKPGIKVPLQVRKKPIEQPKTEDSRTKLPARRITTEDSRTKAPARRITTEDSRTKAPARRTTTGDSRTKAPARRTTTEDSRIRVPVNKKTIEKPKLKVPVSVKKKPTEKKPVEKKPIEAPKPPQTYKRQGKLKDKLKGDIDRLKTKQLGKRKVKRNVVNTKHAGKQLKSTVGKGMGIFNAIAGGILGSALVVAAGDPSKIGSYVGGGIGAGYMAGKGLFGKGTDLVEGTVDRVKDAREQGAQELYAEDYGQYKRIKQDLKFVKDREKRAAYAREFDLHTEEEIDDIMEHAIAYRQYGINNDDIIMRAMQLNAEKHGITDDNMSSMERIGIAKMAQITEGKTKGINDEIKRLEEKGVTDKATLDRIKQNIRFVSGSGM